MVIFDLAAALFAAFGLTCLAWLLYGKLILPVGAEGASVRAVVAAAGDGSGLELTVSGLLWLRRTGLWRGTICIENRGLDAEGAALARRLTDQPGVELFDLLSPADERT